MGENRIQSKNSRRISCKSGRHWFMPPTRGLGKEFQQWMLAPVSLDTRVQPVRHRCSYDAKKKKDPLAQTKATQARLAALGILARGPPYIFRSTRINTRISNCPQYLNIHTLKHHHHRKSVISKDVFLLISRRQNTTVNSTYFLTCS